MRYAPGPVGEVERAMVAVIRSAGAGRAETMALEQLAAGGKRLRARLALDAGRVLGADARDTVAWAAAVELLHNATLVHDDVQDGDRTRRGRPALWAAYGVAQAINAGDFMLMLPYRAVGGVAPQRRADLCMLLVDQAIATVGGQIAELDLLPRGRLDWPSYLAASSGKTGALFALPVMGAALLAGRSAAEARALGEPFADLGLMFQIQDDVLDLYGDKGRDVVGSDLYEGKVSALVVAHLERRPGDRAWLLELLGAPRSETPPAGVQRAIAAFRESGALAASLARIDALAAHFRASPALAAEPGLSALGERLLRRCSVAEVALEGVA